MITANLNSFRDYRLTRTKKFQKFHLEMNIPDRSIELCLFLLSRLINRFLYHLRVVMDLLGAESPDAVASVTK